MPSKRWSGIGVFVEKRPYQTEGTALLVQTRGLTEIGLLRQDNIFRMEDVTERGIAPDKRTTLRLLVRHSLLEFYLADRLVQ